MTLAQLDLPTPVIERFSVCAHSTAPTRCPTRCPSPYVEEQWLPYIGPTALIFARRCDAILKDNTQTVAVIVHRWATDLGVYPEELLAARDRLINWAFAELDPKSGMMSLRRHWPPVPLCVTTPVHRHCCSPSPTCRPSSRPRWRAVSRPILGDPLTGSLPVTRLITPVRSRSDRPAWTGRWSPTPTRWGRSTWATSSRCAPASVCVSYGCEWCCAPANAVAT